MSELHDTPHLAVSYCPGCSPERDPLQEILTVRWCIAHEPRCEGEDDARARVNKLLLVSTGEAGGTDNRAWCEWIHRTRRRVKSPSKLFHKKGTALGLSSGAGPPLS